MTDDLPASWAAAMAGEPYLTEIRITKATIIGGGAFGTALATVIARKGGLAHVWVRDEAQAAKVNEARRNEKYLPEFELHERVVFTSDVVAACRDTQLVLLALPTPYVRGFLTENRSTFPVGVPLLLCAKGIEVESLQTPFEIVRDELPGKYTRWLGVLAGPSFAKEMMRGLPTNVVVASDDPQVSFLAVKLLASRAASFRAYATPDVMGCEIAGAVKNVLAIAAGAAHALGLGNNARAGLLCRGLAEMRRLALASGSSGRCLSGLAGVGDLMLTCSSELSRNFSAGARLAKGEPVQFTGPTGAAGVAEGVLSARAIRDLALAKGVDMPLSLQVYRVLYEGAAVLDALKLLNERPMCVE